MWWMVSGAVAVLVVQAVQWGVDDLEQYAASLAMQVSVRELDREWAGISDHCSSY